MADPSDSGGQRRIAILESAAGVFSRYGFKKTSMDDLARAAGISRQGLYLHFPTKELLFKESILHLVGGMRAGARAALAREDLELEERLIAMFEAMNAHSAGQAKGTYGHMDELLAVAHELLGPQLADFEAATLSDLVKALRGAGFAERWKEVGVSAREVAEMLLSTSHGVKHRATTASEYRDGMRVAVRIACGPRK